MVFPVGAGGRNIKTFRDNGRTMVRGMRLKRRQT